MNSRFSVIVISICSLAAVSLVVIQMVQTRRTFSISDNMFNVSVSTAMDEVIRQLGGEMLQSDEQTATAFHYQDLD